MIRLLAQLHNDEAGFVVSAELIIVCTVAVLSFVVGFSEISSSVNDELEDVGSAVGSINQSYGYSGITGHKGFKVGSGFWDRVDECDSQFDINCNSGPTPEANKWW